VYVCVCVYRDSPKSSSTWVQIHTHRNTHTQKHTHTHQALLDLGAPVTVKDEDGDLPVDNAENSVREALARLHTHNCRHHSYSPVLGLFWLCIRSLLAMY